MDYIKELNKISEIKDEDARKEAIKKLDDKEARIKSWNQPHKVKARKAITSLVLSLSSFLILWYNFGILLPVLINMAVYAHSLVQK